MTSNSDELFAFFFTGDPPDMCPAADVISAGKLIPFNNPPPTADTNVASHLPRRRWAGRRSNKDYHRLPTILEAAPPQPPSTTARRPKWYVFVFGSVRVPAAMEMSDIRTRQRRRSGSPPATAGRESRGGPWKLLRSLSCRGMESAVAATAPLSFV